MDVVHDAVYNECLNACANAWRATCLADRRSLHPLLLFVSACVGDALAGILCIAAKRPRCHRGALARARVCVCVCVCVRESECVYVCVRVREREREVDVYSCAFSAHTAWRGNGHSSHV